MMNIITSTWKARDLNHSIAEIVAVCLVSPGLLVITVYAHRCLPSVSSPRADFIHKESKVRFGLGDLNECTVVPFVFESMLSESVCCEAV